MGIKSSQISRLSSISMRVSELMAERNIKKKDALAGLSDTDLQDLDALLQISYFILNRRDSASRAERTLNDIVQIIEQAATDVESSEYCAEEVLFRVKNALGRITDSHRRTVSAINVAISGNVGLNNLTNTDTITYSR